MKRPSPLVIPVAALALVSTLAVSAFVWGDAPPPVPTPAVSAPPAAIATSTPTASPGSTATPAPTASTLPPGTFENAILGYRIMLPDGYRRSQARVTTGHVSMGNDYYTLQTEEQEREMCLSDSGDVGFPGQALERDPDINVSVSRNVNGVSAAQWATTPGAEGGQAYSTHHKVEATSVGGHEAVRLVTDNAAAETSAFVIRAEDRIYLIHMPFGGLRTGLPPTWLDGIARTFAVIPPAPFPSPTPTTPPRQAASALARDLAAAFSAKDADAVARLMPDCWLNVFPVSTNGGGVLYRSVALFSDALRERFAAGDLTVVVDQAVREDPREAGSFIVSSEWKEPDRARRVDMHLTERDGRWHWIHAAHHGGWPCQSPWVTTPSC